MTSADAQAARLARLQAAATTQRLLVYVDLLQRWNRTYNLTAVRDPDDMVVQHLFDCLAVVPPLKRALAALSDPHVLDVGSGGGLPGIIIAMLLPMVRMVCVDAERRRPPSYAKPAWSSN